MTVTNASAHPSRPDSQAAAIRTDWTLDEVEALFRLPFNDLLFQAHSTHRQFFDPNEVQISTLLSIKTGGCPEDCSYCPQSVRYDTGVEAEQLLPLEEVLAAARRAKASGATRFCMGAAYRNPRPAQLDRISDMVRAVHDLGLETCATLGMLAPEQAETLKEFALSQHLRTILTMEQEHAMDLKQALGD
jgi:biotin synthase